MLAGGKMPVAVMAESGGGGFRRLLEQCETQELEVRGVPEAMGRPRGSVPFQSGGGGIRGGGNVAPVNEFCLENPHCKRH